MVVMLIHSLGPFASASLLQSIAIVTSLQTLFAYVIIQPAVVRRRTVNDEEDGSLE